MYLCIYQRSLHNCINQLDIRHTSVLSIKPSDLTNDNNDNNHGKKILKLGRIPHGYPFHHNRSEEEVTVLDSGPLDERGGASTQLTKP